MKIGSKVLRQDNSFKDQAEDRILEYCRKISIRNGHVLNDRLIAQGIMLPLQSEPPVYDALNEAFNSLIEKGYFELKEDGKTLILTEYGYKVLYQNIP